ncbi:hypothetical protein ACSS6W_003014 [Trichoderma asperelloides]
MKIECIVCGDFKEPEDFSSSLITQECKHVPTTCLECLRSTLRSELERKHWEAIKCPQCSAIFKYQDIQKFADDETKRKYDTLIIQRAVKDDPNFIWCSSDCGSGQLHEGGSDEPIMKCNSCGNLTCSQHRVAWHKGLTCEQYDEKEAARHTEEDKASAETIKHVTKSCPKCKAHIEKNGGW